MADTPVDPEADTFRGLSLVLRARAVATQREVATHAGVSERAVGYWEAGLSHPGAANLRRLIGFYLARGAFTPGREGVEAAALWAAALREAPRLKAPFDGAWFAALLAEARAAAPPAPSRATRPAPPRADWGEAPAADVFHGRAQELAALARWLGDDRCRLVGLLGLGGVGKTALAARAARALAGDFDAVQWRSLRNALPCAEWLAGAVLFLSEQRVAPAEGEEARLRQVLGLLRERRCLLVLDNLETVLEAGAPEARYRSGYAGYGRVLEALGEAGHRGCLLVTSREQPPELRPGEGVDLLRLGGLDVAAGRALLADKGLVGDAAAWSALVERYGGNALALQVVGETIGEIFGGDIAAFLAYATATDGVAFGGIRRLLDAQMERLSATERAVVAGLAVAREPVGFGALLADLGPATPLGAALEAVEGLGRRSLLERGAAATFTLQPVVLEHATARLVEAVAAEVARGEPVVLTGQALVRATAKEYVRRSQERLIGAPIVRRLQADGGAGGAERRLLALLDGWRGRPAAEQGYGPGNVVNLLRLLRGDLRGLDLSHLAIRQAHLAEAEAQDASLAGAHLAEAVLAEAFTYPQTVALSADGALLAAGTSTGEVHLWRVADRTPLLVAAGHTGGVWAVALSADGGLLASGGFDATVRLWEAGSGRPLATLHGHTGAIRGVALSADGRLLASGSFDATVRLWEAPSGRPLATLHGHTGGVEAVALSADGRLAASGGFDGAVRLWEAGSGRPLATLHGHTGAIRGVALSADGRLAASGGADGAVRLWETGSGRPLATLDGHAGGVWGVALSADGGLLASGGADGAVKLWEAGSGRPLATPQGHTGAIRGVALSADGRLAASGGFDATVRLWEAPSGRPLATLHGHTGGVEAVALSADGRLAASGGADGAVRLWEAASGRPLATLHGHTGAIRGVALSADGRLAASGGFDGAVRLWEAPSGRPLATLHGHTGGVWGVALSADGRLAASGGIDGAVRLWETGSGRPLATLRGHTGGVEAVALSADGRLAASGGADATVRLWEAPSGRPLATLHGHTGAIRGVALSADGRLAASGGADGAVRLWETGSGASLHVLRSERRYERLDITGLTGVTEAQRAALLALGAVERGA